MVALVETKVKQYLDAIKKKDNTINAFLEVNPYALTEARALDSKKKKGRLYGKVIAVKSNIHVKGLTCSCASKTLEGYRASYDATVIERIRAEDGLIIGMTNMDEFACGGSGQKSAFGATQNPAAPGRISGGTSSGSAAAVAAGFCDMALGSDTGGSLRNPASCCGVIGVKPSYGCVSRYGLVDSAMSFDQIGPVARTTEDALLLLDVIRGKDERDPTSFDSRTLKLKSISSLAVGLLHVTGVDPRIQRLIDSATRALATDRSWSLAESSLPHSDVAVQAYYLIQYTEFFSGTRRFDGRRFGKKIEESAGREVLRRIYGGAEIVKAESAGRFYHKALAVRALIKESFDTAFEDVDCIISPVCPALPWDVRESMSPAFEYAYDALTVPASLAGVCAISIPIGRVEDIPVGLQIMCPRGSESLLLSIASAFERFSNNLKN